MVIDEASEFANPSCCVRAPQQPNAQPIGFRIYMVETQQESTNLPASSDTPKLAP
jgi:hypothetical protein